MKRGHQIAITVTPLAIILAGVLALALRSARTEEPVYNGYRLSQWIEVALTNAESRTEPRQAIQNIGTNSLPILLQWISYDPPNWRNSLAFWCVTHGHGRFYSTILGHPLRKAGLATIGFRLLGTNAYPAVPELLALFRSKSVFTSRNAGVTLMGLGPDITTQALTNSDPRVRANAAFYFGNYHFPYPIQQSWPNLTQTLVRAFQDESPDARAEATNALRRITAPPEAIPYRPPQQVLVH